jgi:hypothetical protein
VGLFRGMILPVVFVGSHYFVRVTQLALVYVIIIAIINN